MVKLAQVLVTYMKHLQMVLLPLVFQASSLKNFMFAGGGSVGCQTLYHLAKRGVTNAVLLEKDSLTAGTTWHTAGLVWRLRPSDVEIQLLSVKLRPLKYYSVGCRRILFTVRHFNEVKQPRK